jgi:CRP/FNR family transcriptional regulator
MVPRDRDTMPDAGLRSAIGTYLGLKLETVSRHLPRLQREGLIQVQGRVVKLLDRVALSRLANCGV